MIYAVERAGERMWLCGSSGRVRRSLDGGRSWSEGQKLFEAAGVNPSDWCSALSFLDENDGWVAGWGSLWRTSDGGSTWTRLPSMMPRVLRFSDANAITGMVRLDAETAWAMTRGGERLRTTDGGRTWSKVTVPEAPPGLLFRPDGRPVVMLEVTRGRRFEDHVPMVDGGWVAIGASGVMSRALELYEGGHLIMFKGAFSEWDREARKHIEHHVERKLSKAESSRWIRQLSADVARPERPSNCQSTGTIFAKLSWTCGASPSQVLEFETKDCDPCLAAGLVSVTRVGEVDQGAYRRAIGVRKSASMLLREGASK
jgi:hypothetical protein